MPPGRLRSGPGARMLVTSEGWRAGSISGGCLEADLTRQAAFLVSHGRALGRGSDTSEDAGARLGCGGEVDVLLEPVLDGAFIEVLAGVSEGREALELCTLLEERAGEREVRAGGVVVHDWRPALAAARFPGAAVRVTPVGELAARLQPEPGCVAVVMAHHVDSDAAALAVLLRDEGVRSVGPLGPRHRSAQVLGLVEARSGRLTAAQRARLKAPVGLDLGGEGPAAIALSILAEAQTALTGRSARPLSEAEAERSAHG